MRGLRRGRDPPAAIPPDVTAGAAERAARETVLERRDGWTCRARCGTSTRTAGVARSARCGRLGPARRMRPVPRSAQGGLREPRATGGCLSRRRRVPRARDLSGVPAVQRDDPLLLSHRVKAVSASAGPAAQRTTMLLLRHENQHSWPASERGCYGAVVATPMSTGVSSASTASKHSTKIPGERVRLAPCHTKAIVGSSRHPTIASATERVLGEGQFGDIRAIASVASAGAGEQSDGDVRASRPCRRRTGLGVSTAPARADG